MGNKHGFFELEIGGLTFVNQLLSFLKRKETDAKNVLKGVNTTNINRKIFKVIKTEAAPQDLDMNSFTTNKILGGFKVREMYKDGERKGFALGHPYITGRGANKRLIRSSRGAGKKGKNAGTWSITYKKMMDILMYGRREYTVPSEGMPYASKLRWRNKPHYAAKRGYTNGTFYYTPKKPHRLILIPYYRGIDYTEAAREEVERWFSSIQDKFLSKGFNK